jgi:cation transport protein ChaC
MVVPFSFQEVTHGLALKLKDQAALNYLNNREVTLGGYVSHITLFYPRDKSRPPFPILLYIATPTNRHWLGPAPLDDVAEQVILSSPEG